MMLLLLLLFTGGGMAVSTPRLEIVEQPKSVSHSFKEVGGGGGG